MASFWKQLWQRVDPDLVPTIERVFDLVEPKLRLFSDYQKRLQEPVRSALAYAGELNNQLSTEAEINLEEFTSDPFIHALFARPENIKNAIGGSRDVQQYIKEQSSNSGETIYALMGMRYSEKNFIGNQTTHHGTVSDVLQTAAIFSDHTLTCLAANPTTLAQNICDHFVDSLFMQIKTDITEREAERRERETAQQVLASRIRSNKVENMHNAEHELLEIELRLTDLNHLLNYENRFELIAKTIESAAEHLKLTEHQIDIDARGVLRDSNHRLAGHFALHELDARDDRRWFIHKVSINAEHAKALTQERGEKIGESLFLREFVLGIQAQANSKNFTRPFMPAAPPNRLRFAIHGGQRTLDADITSEAAHTCSQSDFTLPIQ
ncbi:hypothetical protein BOW53_15865 [Solemya pervernicosa gill symbiont]|uniref:Uncharacterized protein n=1 Tax=Solemya pervernicosa gill symbiont TaxID=642797 RepID=A0A1T2KZR8_9GAMM|nr:hypothetical protein BOW53_15865 [Solemya pervernicosa gill symbiont]